MPDVTEQPDPSMFQPGTVQEYLHKDGSRRIVINRRHGTAELTIRSNKVISSSYRPDSEPAKKLNAIGKKQEKTQDEKKKRATSQKGKLWEDAGSWASNLLKIKSFLVAGGSVVVEGPVSLPVLDHRHACCHGETIEGVKVSNPCRARITSEGKHYCKACGCGEWRLAELDVPKPHWLFGKLRLWFCKLAYPKLSCPLHKWSAWHGERLKRGPLT